MAGSDDLLALLAADPGAAGLFLDFDGVLAPIVDRPEDAVPPPETRAELERLVAALRARRGRERPGDRGRARRASGWTASCASARTGSSSSRRPSAGGETLAAFAADAPWPPEDIEVKGLAVAFHFRGRDGRAGGGARARPDRGRGARARASSRATGARSSRCCRRSARTREPRCDGCSTSTGCAGRSRPVTTRPTSTPSPRSTGWTSPCAWPSRRPRAPSALLDAADLVVESTDEFLALLRKL